MVEFDENGKMVLEGKGKKVKGKGEPRGYETLNYNKFRVLNKYDFRKLYDAIGYGTANDFHGLIVAFGISKEATLKAWIDALRTGSEKIVRLAEAEDSSVDWATEEVPEEAPKEEAPKS